MNTVFIVNFVGKASPSTIKNLAAITHEHGGKWLISKVNFIENQVAAVIKIDLPKKNEQIVKDSFQNNPDLLCQFTDSDTAVLHDQSHSYQLRVDANDRAGIVNEITNILDEQNVHIVDMDSHRVFIAGGGGVSSSLFSATIVIILPNQSEIQDVINQLESLSEDTRVFLNP